MAYVSHSPYRAYVANRTIAGFDAKIAIVAVLMAGAAIVSLSWASIEQASSSQALAKGDRMATVSIGAATGSSLGGESLSAGSTTTVEKGATTGFSVHSPYLAATR